MQELENQVVYLKHTTLETIKTKVIVTLYKIHFYFTRREDIVSKIRARIQDKTGQESPPFVLAPGFHTHLPLTNYSGSSSIIKQDTILVEAETK